MPNEERILSREFEEHFILATIYDQSFREYVIESIKGDFLTEWETRYLYKNIYKMWVNKYPITFLSVFEFCKQDYNISDEKLSSVLDIIEPFISDIENPILKSVTSGVIQRTEKEVSKNILRSSILNARDLYEKEEYFNAFKVFNVAQDKIKFNKVVGHLFWDEMEDDSEWIKGIPLCMHGDDGNGNIIWLDDNIFYDGLGRGQICFLQGDPSLGKTTLLQNILISETLRGYNVDYYSLEMPFQYGRIRIKSALCDIPTNLYKQDSKIFDKKIKEIYELYPNKGSMKMYDVESRKLNSSLIRHNYNMSLHEGRKVDVIGVDYVDIMESGKNFKERRWEISYNTQSLRDLSKELNIGVISPTKQNRQKTKNPDRTNTAEDYSKAYNSDIFIACSVEGESDGFKTIKCFLDKNRYGKSCIFAMFANVLTGRVFDIFSRTDKHKRKDK